MHLRAPAVVLSFALLTAACFGPSQAPGPSTQPANGTQAGDPPKKKCSASYFDQLTEGNCDAPGQNGRAPELHEGMSTGEGFKPRVEEIQANVPTWKVGAGIAVRMIAPKTHQPFSVSYVDADGPQQQDANGMKLTVVEGLAMNDGKPFGHFVLLTPKLSPGKFKLTPDNARYILISVFGDDLDINNNSATATVNKGSSLDFELRQVDNGTDLEGVFSGKLVSKDGTVVHAIEAGYIYIKQ